MFELRLAVEFYSTAKRFSFDFFPSTPSFPIFAANFLILCHEEGFSFIFFDCAFGCWMQEKHRIPNFD
jgi:hypothetical protein